MDLTRSPASVALALLAGCAGPQSALAPAGRDAERIADLTTWLIVGAVLVWVAMGALFVYALRPREPWSRDRASRLVALGGVASPTVVLTIVLIRGLSLMPAILDPGPTDGLRVEVVGEQFWWRVRYHLPDGRSVELANELRLPVGRRTPVQLGSIDVIHSFWIPSLAGKVDMIPGRTTWLGLEPTKPGVYQGACAEYCGGAHTEMLLRAEVLQPDAFDAWLSNELLPAAPPSDPVARRGAALFEEVGCGACHTVRGTPSRGVLGPDLTHVGARTTVGAGVLPRRDVDALARWIANAEHLKPEVLMPPFDMLPEADVVAIATWLEGLR